MNGSLENDDFSTVTLELGASRTTGLLCQRVTKNVSKKQFWWPIRFPEHLERPACDVRAIVNTHQPRALEIEPLKRGVYPMFNSKITVRTLRYRAELFCRYLRNDDFRLIRARQGHPSQGRHVGVGRKFNDRKLFRAGIRL
ncbi:hypothetical protein Bcen2424_4944 [Burkholderia cenocepacia HI2424]|nr:hypothetical protein Bcen2424_4944 [Burkholderia cenocepacia HI2424]